MTSPVAEKIRVLDQIAEIESRQGFLQHLRHVVIDSRPYPAKFVTQAREWQWDWSRQIAPPLEQLMGLRDTYTGPVHFWRTLARGHDKTTGLGRVANFALTNSRRHLNIFATAADKDQATLLTEAMEQEADHNPWYGKKLRFTRDGVEGPTGYLTIMTSDAPSSAGLRPDLIICDEITHWESRALWDMLFSASGKMADCMTVVITNAGIKQSWQWDLKEIIKKSWRWNVYEPPGRLPTWMSEVNIAEDRKALLPSEARRLLDNQWIDPGEESGYLTRAEVQACIDLGVTRGLREREKGDKGVEYWAGIDYGPKRDRTALSILHQSLDGVIELDRLDVWQGSPEKPILVSQVRDWVADMTRKFVNLNIVVDPHELEEMVQDLERRLMIERWEARGGKANYTMAERLRSLIVSRQIALYPGAGRLLMPDGAVEDVVDELSSLVTQKMSYGYRFDHEATKHDDRAVAIGMPVAVLLERPRPALFSKPPVIVTPNKDIRIGRRSEKSSSAGRRGLYGMK